MRYGISTARRWSPPVATKEELMTICQAATYLLENVGIGGVTPKLQKTFKDLGCTIADEKKGTVKIPGRLALQATNEIPTQQILPGRVPENDIAMSAGSNHTCFGAFGIMALYAKWNPVTRQHEFRDGVDADNWKEQKVVEYFPEFDLTSPIYLPMDLAEAGLPVDTHDLNSTIQCTTKHIWHIDAIDHIDCYTELAAEALGGYEELAKRPFITNHGDTPGLVYGQKTSDRMSQTLEGWEKGKALLIDHTDVCIPGFQGPDSVAGAYAVTVATSMSMAVGLALGKNGIAKGRIPVMTYDLVMAMDPYTQMLCSAGEQFQKAQALHVNFWHRNFPTPKATMWPGIVIGGLTGGSDTQAGIAAWTMFNALINGTDEAGCWSPTVGPNGIRMEGYAMNAEMIGVFSWYMKDLDFSADSYKFNTWLKKTPRGDFMREPDVLRRMADLSFFPMRQGYGLYETRQYLRWIEDKLNMDDRAYALTQKIIKEFPAPLPPKDVANRMNEIVAKWDKVLQIGGYTVDKSGTGARF